MSFTALNSHSRLVLIDFWATWCGPCLKAIPHLAKLQQQYGPQGLLVVGIDYGNDPARLRTAQTQLHVNYPMLMGKMNSCPVKQKFQVRMFPTLVLLDDDGNIVWHAEGPSEQQLRRLERLVQTQLAAR